MLAILVSMRPKQWTKNLILFAALVFSQTAGVPGYFIKTLEAFIVFCLLSGSIYIFNDLLDLESDRKHPSKRTRPLAQGRLKPWIAWIATFLIITGVTVWAYSLGRGFLITSMAYVLLQIAYTLYLKHAVILDVFSIATGFVLRTVAGAEVIHVSISSWLLICTMLLALFLAMCKRRHELTLLESGAKQHRKILAEYSTPLLDQMISVVTSATVLSYALYTIWPDTVDKFHTGNLIYTVPFVLYGVFRYLYLVHKKDKGGSPDLVLLTDVPIIVCILLYCLAVWVILYHGYTNSVL